MTRWTVRVAAVAVLLAACGASLLLSERGAATPAAEPAASVGTNGRIAFVVEESYPGSDAASDSWVVTVRPDGSRARRVGAYAYGPVAYSPLGRRLAYSGWDDGLIHVVNLTGRARDRRVTSPVFSPGEDDYAYDSEPDWSPSGRRIAFMRSHYDSGLGRSINELWIHYVGGGRRLIDGASPSWSAKGDIAFAGADRYIYVIRPDGSGLRRVGSSRCSDPAWSPDGKRIVCVAGSDIASIGADGSGFHRLTHGGDQDTGPVFSPDGMRIAFVRNGFSIVTMSRAGRRLKTVAKRVSFDPDCCELTIYGPDWRPDPRR
jgi:dipeptidyl aminopeptidase/acylaminoacyl peptidase